MKKKIVKRLASILSSFFVFSGLNQKKIEGFAVTSALIYSAVAAGSIAALRIIMGMVIKSIIFGENSQEEAKFLELAKKINSDEIDFLKVNNASSYPDLGSKLILHARHVQCPFGDEILDGVEYSFDPIFVEIAKSSNKLVDLNDLGKTEDFASGNNLLEERQKTIDFNGYILDLEDNNEDSDSFDKNLYKNINDNINEILSKSSIYDKIPEYSLETQNRLITRFVKSQKNNQKIAEFSEDLPSKVNKIRENLNLEGKYILYNGQMWNPTNIFLDYSGYLQDIMISGGKIVVYEYPERYSQGKTSPLKWLTRSDKRLISSKRAVYDDMEKNYGGENIIMCGYSMGGNISIRLTDEILKDNKKLAGLILISPAHATFDCLRTYGKSAGWSDNLISTIEVLAHAGVAEVPGFPEFNKAPDSIKSITEHEDFPIYLTTGNSKDFFYLGYTNLDESFNRKNQVSYVPEEKDSDGNEISVDHCQDSDMIWGEKFANWLKKFDTKNQIALSER